MDNPTHVKTCTKCGATKPLDEFGKASWCKDGHRGTCKECRLTRTPAAITEKQCTKCLTTKPVEEFQRRSGSADGYSQRCKVCRSAYRKAKYDADPEGVLANNRAWYAANRESQIATVVAWKKAHPEKVRQYARVGYDRHREEVREYGRRWYLANRERALAQSRAWQRANPERFAEILRRRRARLAAATIGETDVSALWEAQDGHCGLCGEPIDPGLKFPDLLSKSIDHIVPLSKGGTHEQANLQWSHLVCNIRKGNRPSD